MAAFYEEVFKAKVNNALVKVKTILDNSRNPELPANVPHEYEDKYLLAEFLVNNAIAAQMNALESIGLNEKHLVQMREWAKTRSVSLRLRAEEKCKFLRKVEREVQSDTTSVHTSTVFGTSKSYTVTKITEWFWQFDAKYELVAFMGNDTEKVLTLASRAGTVELKTSADATPKPTSVVRPNVDLNLSWLLVNLDDASHFGKFSIDRQVKSCHTPRRNDPINAALGFARGFSAWCSEVEGYFMRNFFPVETGHSYDMGAIKEGGMFVPVIALFEKSEGNGPHALPRGVSLPFLAEQKRTIQERFAELAKVFPANTKLITHEEAKLVVTMFHVRSILSSMSEGIDYIESMLYKQLVAAIGKEVTPVDFSNYQRYHNRKLFKQEFQPRPFCYAIRRPDHYPEGLLSIENQLADGTLADPVYTSSSHSVARRSMRFPINASTDVSFLGDRYLHGFIMHQFSGQSGSQLALTARARQFSSFIVLVGAIASADLFEPKYAMIIQNKDDLKIPLNLETIPTPKEFRDAIESLSPEQQRFAKAYRAMQLESTLFGVVVIQIKPQLEKLLNLDDDSLTKEIQLTQDLMTLFIEYQIPCDLISFDGSALSDSQVKVERVKDLVGKMHAMIKRSKDQQLEEARLKEEQRRAALAVPVTRPTASPVVYSSPTVHSRGGGGGGRSVQAPMMAPTNAPRPSAVAKSASPMSKSLAPMPSAPPPAALVPAPQPVPVSMSAPAPAPAPMVVAPVLPVAQAAAPAEQAAKVPEPKAPEQKEKGKSDQSIVTTGNTGELAGEVIDYTKIPQQLERKFEQLDVDSALRPTIITAGTIWEKKFQKALLAAPDSATLLKAEQGHERNKAFDLLDAITKSGCVGVDAAELHVIIAATHCFDKSLMNTVIQDNVNPIEKVERSALILASAVHNLPPVELIANDQRERIGLYSPMLLQQ